MPIIYLSCLLFSAFCLQYFSPCLINLFLIMRKPCGEKKNTKKGTWSKQEDRKLVNHIQQHDQRWWSSLPRATGLLRCKKSCRLRWVNYLRPDLKQGNFGEDEEDLIIKLHALLGNRWSLIARRLPGRTDNEVKNHWNTHIKRKLLQMGIDPNNRRMILSGINTMSKSNVLNESNSSSTINYGDRDDNIALINPASGSESSSKTSSLPDLNLDITIAPPLVMDGTHFINMPLCR